MPKKRNQDPNTRQTWNRASLQPAQQHSAAKLDQTRDGEKPVPELTQEKESSSPLSVEMDKCDLLQETQESVDYFDDIGFPETNVALVVEDKKIHVNKAVLSKHSPVFNAMFYGGFKERTAKEIKLGNKKAKDVVEFLRCFYPNMKHAITEINVLKVLPLAHEYQSPLVDNCEKLMISKCKQGTGLTVTSLLDYIIAAEKYDLETFLDTAVEFCSHVDFDLLNGKTIQRRQSRYDNYSRHWIYDDCVQEDKEISSKFLDITLKTRHAISVERLQVLEKNKRKMKIGEQNEEDYHMILHAINFDISLYT
ncbi:uncharacterized protein LOC134264698 [Saccostrea cucullata]|uniref:uncharacterized protein LOC134264698 n=1 Tax=Saccostrea cuccullata TaxID=36930 RepID=UPI002ED1FDFA